jgi:hypothetical protein
LDTTLNTQKYFHSSAFFEYALTSLENYIGATTMDEWESKVQPMNQWGNKEGRQEIWKRAPIQRILPICFHLSCLESGKDDSLLEAQLQS